jgi:hypothetical protein
MEGNFHLDFFGREGMTGSIQTVLKGVFSVAGALVGKNSVVGEHVDYGVQRCTR